MAFKRVGALLVVGGLFGLTALAPGAVLRQYTQVEFLHPSFTLYEQRVKASGQIVAGNSWSLYLEQPVMASAVHVELGEQVQAGELLAELEQAAPTALQEQALPALRSTTGLPVEGSYLESLSGRNTAGSTPEQVTAPMDGIVSALNLEGPLPSSLAQPAVTISDPNSFEAVVQVRESEIAQIQVGNQAVLKGSGFSGRTYTGTVARISPVARRETLSGQEAMVDVYISIAGPDTYLKEGFTVQAEISAGEARPLLTVPYAAVGQDENNLEYVYLAKGSQAVRQEIVTGIELTHSVEVAQGLASGDVVLADASQITRDGERILLRREGE